MLHEYYYLAHPAKIIILHEMYVAYNRENAASVHQPFECTPHQLYAIAWCVISYHKTENKCVRVLYNLMLIPFSLQQFHTDSSHCSAMMINMKQYLNEMLAEFSLQV